jgi:hypothetical protein
VGEDTHWLDAKDPSKYRVISDFVHSGKCLSANHSKRQLEKKKVLNILTSNFHLNLNSEEKSLFSTKKMGDTEMYLMLQAK